MTTVRRLERHHASISLWIFALLGSLAATPAPGDDPDGAWQVTSYLPRVTVPAMQQVAAGEEQLVLDDGTSEGSFGIGALTARQFLWFNHFSPGRAISLQEIWVLFPSVHANPGDAIDLVVYQDSNGDPTDGAELLAVIPETVRYADGTTFSIYPLPAEIPIDGEDIYLGVIPRFLISGVSAPSLPAALDTTSSQQRSWVAQWTGDPPAAPHLPPSGQLQLIDDLVPGNWMIRGVGQEQILVEVPVSGFEGMLLFSALLLLAGISRCGLPRR